MSSCTRLRRTYVKMIGFGEDAPEHPRVHEGHDAQRQFVVEPRISSFFVVINSPIIPAGRKINWRILYFWTTEAIRWLTQHRRRLWARSRADFFSVPRIWRRRELTSRALASGKMSTPKSPIRDGEREKSVKTTPPCWFQAAKTIINEPETDRPKKTAGIEDVSWNVSIEINKKSPYQARRRSQNYMTKTSFKLQQLNDRANQNMKTES